MDQHRQHWRVPDESYQEDLPNVDDLEVAAAAAGELMRPAASSDQVSSSESSEEESSSSGEESTSDDDDDDDESQASGSSGRRQPMYAAFRLKICRCGMPMSPCTPQASRQVRSMWRSGSCPMGRASGCSWTTCWRMT